MKLKMIPERTHWKEKVENLGFLYHTHENGKYWTENHYYQFSIDEIFKIEKAASELHKMCFDAVDYVIQNDYFSKMGIPKEFVLPIVKSWEQDEPSFYGRFDFSYKNNQIKLLEYNADTPTSLIESSIVQYFWMQEQKILFPTNKVDQFNSLHEHISDFWNWYVKSHLTENEIIYFTSLEGVDEDVSTTEYIRDACACSGVQTELIYLQDIGWNGSDFVDLENRPIKHLFKLYPWEILRNEDFGPLLINSNVKCLEPKWKMILSNKALLPILWELFPDHPNLLPAFFDGSKFENKSFVRKPIFSREGANIEIFNQFKDIKVSTGGEYGAEGHIYQEFFSLPKFETGYPMLGVWMIGEKPCGMGIRESSGLVTDNRSQYVPHIIS